MNNQQWRVLLVDPQQASREDLAAFLREYGPFEVDTVAHGAEAWRRIQHSEQYRVVVMDELLPPTAGAPPERIGIDLVQKFKSHCPSLEIILFRAPDMPSGLKQALQAGAWCYLDKLYDRRDLLTLIEHSAESRKLRQETREKRQLSHQVEQLEALRRTTLAIMSPLESRDLLHEILKHAVALLRAKGGGFYKYHADREELEIVADYDQHYAIGRTIKVGVGVVGRLVQTREPSRIVDDYTQSPDRIPEWPEHTVFSALLEVPLVWQERILGVLFVGDDLGRKFTVEDAHLLRSFADLATIALVNADLTAQEAAKSQRLEKLVRATKDIAGELGKTTLRARLDLIAHHMADLLDAEASCVLLQHSPGLMCLEAAYGHIPGSRKIGRQYPIRSGTGQGLIEHIAYNQIAFREHGEALKYHWASDGSALGQLPSRERYSMLALPLSRQVGDEKQWVGVIRVENKRGPDGRPHLTLGFSDDDERILSIFAEAVVGALENVRLFEEAQAARNRLHASFQASNKLLSSPKPLEVLHEIGEQARIAANAQGARVIWLTQAGIPQIVVATPAIYNDPDYEMRKEGITSKVMRTGEPQIIHDAENPGPNQQLNPRWKEEGTRAFCALPLRVQDKTVGVMLFYYGEPRSFPEFEIEALQLYANQAAAIYDSARRIEQLELVRQAAETLVKAESFSEVVQQIADNARAVLQADVVDVWPYDAEQERFMLDAVVTAAPQNGGRSPLLPHGITSEQVVPSVMAQQWRGLTSLAEVDHKMLPDDVRQHLQHQGIQSVQGLTLTAGTEKLGVLLMYYRTPSRFSEEEQETARTFATHAALALKQIRLLEQVSQAKHAAEVVARVTALGGNEVTLESIAQGTREAVGCDAVTLCVYTQRADGIEDTSSGQCSRVIGVTYNGHAEHVAECTPGTHLRSFLAYDEPRVVKALPPEFVGQVMAPEWVSVLPLHVAAQKIGVMLIRYHAPHRFSTEALANLQQFAKQVAVAIHNGQLYRQAQKRARALQAIYEAGQALTGSLHEREILEKIALQLVRLPEYRDDSRIVVSAIWLKEGSSAKLIASYSHAGLETAPAQHQEDINLQPAPGERRGLVGLAITTGAVQCIYEPLNQHPDFVQCYAHARSELVVPITISGEVIGAINVEHSDEYAFDQEDVQIVQALAAQASVTIQNARHMRIVAARTVVAWMGMASMAWRHTIGNLATTIQDEVTFLLNALDTQPSHASLKAGLEAIARFAADIRATPITAPLSTEEGVSSVVISDLLTERFRRLWGREPYQSITLHWQPSADPLMVRVSAEWFIRALDIVLDNAVEAMATTPQRILNVALQVAGNRVEMSIRDTGCGITSDIQEHLLKGRIPKPVGTKGSGVGLLMAQTILQTYGGDIRLGSSGPDGTTIILWLPLETPGTTLHHGPEASQACAVVGDEACAVTVVPHRMEHALRQFLLVGHPQANSWLPILQEALVGLGVLNTVLPDQVHDCLNQHIYDVILIDATDVREVPALITAIQAQQADAKILVGTSYQEWEDTRAVLRAGALDYINKATAVPTLRTIFSGMLDGVYDPFVSIF